jgi:hypothetical protein
VHEALAQRVPHTICRRIDEELMLNFHARTLGLKALPRDSRRGKADFAIT